MNTVSGLLHEERKGNTATFSAPLGAVKKGHLEIASGISNLDLTGDLATQDLFHSVFVGQIPDVRIKNERVIIRYPHSLTEWLTHLLLPSRHAARISLNASIPWQIEIRRGAAHIDADLRALQLSSLAIAGGVAETTIFLPRPSKTVPVHIASGVSKLTIVRPEGVAARLDVNGGISRLAFDDLSYGSIGSGIHLETPAYKDHAERYDIRIRGGVSNLSVRAQPLLH